MIFYRNKRWKRLLQEMLNNGNLNYSRKFFYEELSREFLILEEAIYLYKNDIKRLKK